METLNSLSTGDLSAAIVDKGVTELYGQCTAKNNSGESKLYSFHCEDKGLKANQAREMAKIAKINALGDLKTHGKNLANPFVSNSNYLAGELANVGKQVLAKIFSTGNQESNIQCTFYDSQTKEYVPNTTLLKIDALGAKPGSKILDTSLKKHSRFS